ncbi:MAG TPA: hypothetical protein VEB66_14870, partial [Opitutaceae bacterium]|nr:hypothetical protein [Opitutaceae bacterium]
MKTIACLLLTAALAAPLGAQTAPASPAAPSVMTVNAPPAVVELAQGFAAAASRMSVKSLVIYVRGEKDVTAIRGIRSVIAINGVLLVQFSAGDMVAVGADRVVM